MKRVFRLYYGNNIIVGYMDELLKFVNRNCITDFKMVGISNVHK